MIAAASRVVRSDPGYGTDFLPDGQISSRFAGCRVQPHLQKYSCSLLTQISSLIRAVLSQERGVAHVINAGRDAVDAGSARWTNRADADGEVVWF
jgi:hypothetical protein